MTAGRVGCLLALQFLVGVQVFAANVNATVRSSDGRPIEDAAVVLEPVAGVTSKHRRTVTIQQRDREFIPYVTVVETGTLIEFPNRDPFKHHIYSFSPAKIFEIKLYADKPVLPVLFDKAGEVALGCNIHDWMEAYVLVVDTPYFGKTGIEGNSTLQRIPAGHYRVRAWHPRQKTEFQRQEIDIAAGAAPVKLELTLDVAARVVKPKPPADSGKY